MPPPTRYPVPAGTYRVEEEIRRSRFITTVGRAATVEDASAFIRGISREFADATHNCWAYLVGPPGSTGAVGMSDAGEPHGTAGRPMLNALLHGGVGDVAVVVTRYYGGTKLGTGGLVRAYGGGVQQALATLPRAERVRLVTADLAVDYAWLAPVQQVLAATGARIVSEEYGAAVRYRLEIPEDQLEPLQARVLEATRGQARVNRA